MSDNAKVLHNGEDCPECHESCKEANNLAAELVTAMREVSSTPTVACAALVIAAKHITMIQSLAPEHRTEIGAWNVIKKFCEEMIQREQS